MFSDFINYKAPLSDYGRVLSSPANCMVDPIRSISTVKPSQVKHFKRGNIFNVQSRPAYVEMIVDFKPQSCTHHGPKGNSEQSNIVKGLKPAPEVGSGKSEAIHDMPLDKCDKGNLRQRSKVHSNHFTSRFHVLDLMHSEDRESNRGLVDAVVDFLHKSRLKEDASSVWEAAVHKNVYPDAVKDRSSCYWLINLHVMLDGTAVTALSRTLTWFRQQMLLSGIGPSRIDIVTGWGRRSRVTGSSMVRQAVQNLLHIFSFPFFTEMAILDVLWGLGSLFVIGCTNLVWRGCIYCRVSLFKAKNSILLEET